jgi:hypothetical protein
MSRKVPTLAIVLALMLGGQAIAQNRPVPDTFRATTTNMSPADLGLKLDVLEWPDADARAEVVEALSADEDIRSKLLAVPTLGYVWIDGSSVGYSIKYAHRETDASGQDRVTVVTDRALGSYSFEPWQIGGQSIEPDTPYSVIELNLTTGMGIVSPAADVTIDADNALVYFDGAPSEPVLSEVRLEPKPYWARGG